MKKLLFFLVFLSNLISYSQEVRNTDRFFVNSQKYVYEHLSWGQSSYSKPFKIIVCTIKDSKSIENNIRLCQKFKLEYTDYYILSLLNVSKNQKCIEIIKVFLKIVDENRIATNLSRVILRKKTEDGAKPNQEIQYFVNVSISADLNDVEDLYINVEPKSICNAIRG